MTLNLNTIHLFRVSYGCGSRCTGSESFYSKDYKQARLKANSRCASHDRVITLEKFVQRKSRFKSAMPSKRTWVVQRHP